MANFTSFKGVSHIGDSLLSDQLATNLSAFCNWSFLGIGAFFNVNKPTSGVYGGYQQKLRLSEDPYFVKGRVWEGFRSNWIWETGIEYGIQPITISGVYLNNNFISISNTGTNSFYIDYPKGRIVFNNKVSPTSTVEVEYSYRYVNVYTSDIPEFKQLMFNSFRVDDNQFNQYGSGVWSILPNSRIQMPAVIIEPIAKTDFKPYQMGGGQYIYKDVLFHVFAETPFERNNIADIISFQKYKKILMFDKNQMVNATGFPINPITGMTNPNFSCYPQLLEKYPYNKSIYFSDSQSQQLENRSPGFFRAVVKLTCEMVSFEI